MTATKTDEVTSPQTEPVPIVTRAWWHRNLDPDERRRVMDELVITRVDQWGWRFTVMITLSVVVAVMGMSANSAAVVIGAMLLAPLMTPVLAAAACLSMSLVRKSLWSLVKVGLATAWCIFIAYVLARFVIANNGSLPSEVESRTRPDIRDLFVALAAGAAGAYATVRKDVSSSLPGVAVAVALVPPLGAVGITLEAGKLDLAAGSALLYFTNLAAIIFAGVMVFIATGFVPPRRLVNTAVQLVVAFVVALAVVVVVAVPLYNRSVEIVEAAENEVTAAAIVDDWLGGADLSPDVDVQDERVLVQLRGFEPPPDEAELTADLQAAFGDVQVLVEWIRTERATTTTVAGPTDDELLQMEIEPIVEAWLAGELVVEPDADVAGGEEQGVGPESCDCELRELVVRDGAVRLDLAGSGEPPPVDDLTDRIAGAIGSRLSVRLYWTERETITPEDQPSPDEIVEAGMRARADEWAASAGVDVEQLAFDGERVRIELIGMVAPDIGVIVADMRGIAGFTLPVDVFFTRQQQLTTTTVAPGDLFAPGLPTPTTSTTTTTP